VRKSPRAPVLIGRFDPMRRKDDAWVNGVRAAVKAINRAGGKAKLTYKWSEVRKRNGLIGGSVCHGHRPLIGAYTVRAPLAACP